MEPFYFGKPPKLLFGIYHPPKTGMARDVGVVLCYPLGQEYIRSHRAFLRLSVRLMSAGYHVLRFDYFGCGDSEGDSSDGEVHQWVSDISTAVEELKGGSGVDRICLIGLRLGGSLSVMAGAERGDIDGMVLWDPITNGEEYIKELAASHEEWLQGSFAKPQSRADSKADRETLGFPLTRSLVEGIEKTDLLSNRKMPANNILLVETKEIPSNGRFREHLEAVGANVSHRHLPGPEVWIKGADEMEKGLVPVQVLESVVSWMSEVYS